MINNCVRSTKDNITTKLESPSSKGINESLSPFKKKLTTSNSKYINQGGEICNKPIIEIDFENFSNKLIEYEKEYAEKFREKKVWLDVIAQLKKEIQVNEVTKDKIKGLHEKWHNESLKICNKTKTNETFVQVLKKTSENVQMEVDSLDKEIRSVANENAIAIEKIQFEKETISQLQEKIQELKASLLKETKEKDKLKNEVQVSSKFVVATEEKLRFMIEEREVFANGLEKAVLGKANDAKK